jgi:hypothetical protein
MTKREKTRYCVEKTFPAPGMDVNRFKGDVDALQEGDKERGRKKSKKKENKRKSKGTM